MTSTIRRVGKTKLVILLTLLSVRAFSQTVGGPSQQASAPTATPPTCSASIALSAKAAAKAGTSANGDSKIADAPDATGSKAAVAAPPAASSAAPNSAKSAITGLLDRLPDQSVAKDALALIDEIVKQSRESQALVYSFAKSINAILAYSEDDLFVTNVRVQTQKLIDVSYNDSLLQNKNLSDQVKRRLESLLADSVNIIACTIDPADIAKKTTSDVEQDKAAQIREKERQKRGWDRLKKGFLDELTLVTNRFVDSRRFRLGIGAEYIYLPQMSYATTPNIDLTPYQVFGQFPPQSGNQPIGLVDFSNRSTAALVLSANVPAARIDFSLPSQSQSQSLTTNVQRIAIAQSPALPDLLVKTTVESTARAQYNASLSTTVRCIGRLFQYCDTDLSGGVQPDRTRWDIGIGVGTTGFRVDETATSDVRVRSDSSKSFNDLTSSGSPTSKRSFAFHKEYLLLSLKLQVSDELQLALASRSYRRSTVDTGVVNIQGVVISMSLVWYPTFGW